MKYRRYAFAILMGVVLTATLLAILLGSAAARPAAGTTISPNIFTDELNTDGDCSLREAIQSANTDTAVSGCAAGSGADTILLAAGTYVLGLTGKGEDDNARGDLDITSDITILGAGAKATTIDAKAKDRVFDVQSGTTVEINGVTITGGDTGGGSPDVGGGIYVLSATLTLKDSVVSDNTANIGGGINVSGNAVVSIENSTLSGNTAAAGGGIRQTGGTIGVLNTTISGNASTQDPSLGGGGIFIDGGFGSTTLNINHSTIAGNTSATHAAGIRTLSDPLFGSTPVVNMKNTILALNTLAGAGSGPDCLAVIDSAGNNILGNDANCTFNAGAGDQVGTSSSPIDPAIGALADNGGETKTRALQEGSPAIEAGTCTDIDGATVSTDQRGVSRPQGSDCDIGAFELEPSGGGDPPPGDGEQPAANCNGNEATITGTTGDDVIMGTSGDDVIAALAGNDVVFGMSGDDAICGGRGQDVLDGNDGNDWISGGRGGDKIRGGDGWDKIFGNGGNDQIVAGSGNDLVKGGGGDDQVEAGDGDDVVYGGPGNDLLRAAEGDDILLGNAGDDTLNCGPGTDIADGGSHSTGDEATGATCELLMNVP